MLYQIILKSKYFKNFKYRNTLKFLKTHTKKISCQLGKSIKFDNS